MSIRRKNPFILQPGEFWANRSHLLNELTDRIDFIKKTDNNDLFIIVGDYGSGTTHTLLYIRNLLKKENVVVSNVTIPIDKSLSSLFRRFIEDLDELLRVELIKELSDNIFRISRTRDKKIRHSAFDVSEIIEKVIMGYDLRLSEQEVLEELGISKYEYEEENVIYDLWVRSLKILTKSMPVFLLIDEFDYLEKDEPLIYIIRRLYDEILYGLNIIITLKGTPNDVEIKLDKALRSRITLNPFYLYPISTKEALDFISKLLIYSGYANSKNLYKPFDEEAILILAEMLCPTTPRNLLRVCSIIFEEARRIRKRKIDKNVVLNIIQKFGSIYIQDINSRVHEEIIFIDDFETEDIELKPSKWETRVNDGTVRISYLNGGAEGTAKYITISSPHGSQDYIRKIIEHQKKIKIIYYLRQEEYGSSGVGAGFHLLYDNKEAIWLCIRKKFLTYYDIKHNQICPIELGKWYKIQVEADCTTGTFNCLVNDELLVNNGNFRNKVPLINIIQSTGWNRQDYWSTSFDQIEINKLKLD